ncbi:P2 family phage major capsid protein [Candidatus Thiothrix sp. Deng01]|uniref:P2 family phage major capsid protein n=1 Tax=Candidatus Thiothrix phosphatis TaxID=3112415 RepID=A0ABU6CX43_9GAMM|nr:P2 family phage major capsid protein [Candidatus Thiothrix sp. Deng01]MEB4591391.1 P2 family phage major capsid protein [Candidatus Thiothrix sp. Deng01]
MSNVTPQGRAAINNMMQGLQRDQGIAPNRVTNIAPRTAQTIEERVMQSNAFLALVNNTPVREVKGDILAFGVPGNITKRTRTANADGTLRRPTDPTDLVQRQYECHEVEQDSVITWDKIDAWAHLPNFYERFRQQVLFAQARDRLKVMWHGQRTEPHSADPELRDINEGFFQFMINELPENVLGLNPDGSVSAVKIGEGGDFPNLDALVYHLRYELLHKLFRNRTGLRVLIGDELIVRENTSLLGAATIHQATERAATGLLLNSRSFGRTDVVESDEFPMRGVFLSELPNLSRYWQESSYRRKVAEDDHLHKGVVDFTFVREDYVVEAAEGCACVHPDAIQLKNAEGEWVGAADVWKMP